MTPIKFTTIYTATQVASPAAGAGGPYRSTAGGGLGDTDTSL